MRHILNYYVIVIFLKIIVVTKPLYLILFIHYIRINRLKIYKDIDQRLIHTLLQCRVFYNKDSKNCLHTHSQKTILRISHFSLIILTITLIQTIQNDKIYQLNITTIFNVYVIYLSKNVFSSLYINIFNVWWNYYYLVPTRIL